MCGTVGLLEIKFFILIFGFSGLSRKICIITKHLSIQWIETVHLTNSTSINPMDVVILVLSTVPVACWWHRRWQLELFGSVVLAAHRIVEWFPVIGFHHGCLPSFLVKGRIKGSHSDCVESIKSLAASNRNSQKGLLWLLLVRRNLVLFADVLSHIYLSIYNCCIYSTIYIQYI